MLTCDGISIHKGIGVHWSQTEYVCFPLELIILNLPPEVQTQDQYVYSLGIVPGPHELKHLNNFIWLFYLECVQGLQGIQTYHSLYCEFFPMCFYLTFSFGNLKAMIKLKGTIGVGALKPCHQCNVAAIRDMWSTVPKSKTYYVPLTVPGKEENCLSAEILQNLCTHWQFEETYHQLDTAGSKAEWKCIWRETGISHSCILSLLPSFNMVQSVPHGFMHTVCINLFRALIKLWHSEYKGPDSGTGQYCMSSQVHSGRKLGLRPGELWRPFLQHSLDQYLTSILTSTASQLKTMCSGLPGLHHTSSLVVSQNHTTLTCSQLSRSSKFALALGWQEMSSWIWVWKYMAGA